MYIFNAFTVLLSTSDLRVMPFCFHAKITFHLSENNAHLVFISGKEGVYYLVKQDFLTPTEHKPAKPQNLKEIINQTCSAHANMLSTLTLGEKQVSKDKFGKTHDHCSLLIDSCGVRRQCQIFQSSHWEKTERKNKIQSANSTAQTSHIASLNHDLQTPRAPPNFLPFVGGLIDD